MSRLVRAELMKLRTIRTFYGLLIATVALTALSVVGSILGAGNGGSPPLDTGEGVRNVFGSGGGAAVLSLVLGILVVTGELRHGTITQTFLNTPRRRLVVVAKVAAMAAAGAFLGAAAAVVTVAVAVPWLSAKDVSFSLLGSDGAPVVLAALLSAALFGVVGVGVGALIRNQVAAIVVALVWQFVLENIVVGLLPSVGKWLPQGAGRALAQETLSSGRLLPAWAGGLVLAAYAAVFAALGAAVLVRRDVT